SLLYILEHSTPAQKEMAAEILIQLSENNLGVIVAVTDPEKLSLNGAQSARYFGRRPLIVIDGDYALGLVEALFYWCPEEIIGRFFGERWLFHEGAHRPAAIDGQEQEELRVAKGPEKQFYAQTPLEKRQYINSQLKALPEDIRSRITAPNRYGAIARAVDSGNDQPICNFISQVCPKGTMARPGALAMRDVIRKGGLPEGFRMAAGMTVKLLIDAFCVIVFLVSFVLMMYFAKASSVKEIVIVSVAIALLVFFMCHGLVYLYDKFGAKEKARAKKPAATAGSKIKLKHEKIKEPFKKRIAQKIKKRRQDKYEEERKSFRLLVDKKLRGLENGESFDDVLYRGPVKKVRRKYISFMFRLRLYFWEKRALWRTFNAFIKEESARYRKETDVCYEARKEKAVLAARAIVEARTSQSLREAEQLQGAQAAEAFLRALELLDGAIAGAERKASEGAAGGQTAADILRSQIDAAGIPKPVQSSSQGVDLLAQAQARMELVLRQRTRDESRKAAIGQKEGDIQSRLAVGRSQLASIIVEDITSCDELAARVDEIVSATTQAIPRKQRKQQEVEDFIEEAERLKQILLAVYMARVLEAVLSSDMLFTAAQGCLEQKRQQLELLTVKAKGLSQLIRERDISRLARSVDELEIEVLLCFFVIEIAQRGDANRLHALAPEFPECIRQLEQNAAQAIGFKPAATTPFEQLRRQAEELVPHELWRFPIVERFVDHILYDCWIFRVIDSQISGVRERIASAASFEDTNALAGELGQIVQKLKSFKGQAHDKLQEHLRQVQQEIARAADRCLESIASIKAEIERDWRTVSQCSVGEAAPEVLNGMLDSIAGIRTKILSIPSSSERENTRQEYASKLAEKEKSIRDAVSLAELRLRQGKMIADSRDRISASLGLLRNSARDSRKLKVWAGLKSEGPPTLLLRFCQQLDSRVPEALELRKEIERSLSDVYGPIPGGSDLLSALDQKLREDGGMAGTGAPGSTPAAGMGKFESARVMSQTPLSGRRVEVVLELKKFGFDEPETVTLICRRNDDSVFIEWIKEAQKRKSADPGISPVIQGIFGLDFSRGIDNFRIEEVTFQKKAKFSLADVSGICLLEGIGGRPFVALLGDFSGSFILWFHELGHLAHLSGKLTLETALGCLDEGQRAGFDKKMAAASRETGADVPPSVQAHYALKMLQDQFWRIDNDELRRALRIAKNHGEALAADVQIGVNSLLMKSAGSKTIEGETARAYRVLAHCLKENMYVEASRIIEAKNSAGWGLIEALFTAGMIYLGKAKNSRKASSHFIYLNRAARYFESSACWARSLHDRSRAMRGYIRAQRAYQELMPQISKSEKTLLKTYYRRLVICLGNIIRILFTRDKNFWGVAHEVMLAGRPVLSGAEELIGIIEQFERRLADARAAIPEAGRRHLMFSLAYCYAMWADSEYCKDKLAYRQRAIKLTRETAEKDEQAGEWDVAARHYSFAAEQLRLLAKDQIGLPKQTGAPDSVIYLLAGSRFWGTLGVILLEAPLLRYAAVHLSGALGVTLSFATMIGIILLLALFHYFIFKYWLHPRINKKNLPNRFFPLLKYFSFPILAYVLITIHPLFFVVAFYIHLIWDSYRMEILSDITPERKKKKGITRRRTNKILLYAGAAIVTAAEGLFWRWFDIPRMRQDTFDIIYERHVNEEDFSAHADHLSARIASARRMGKDVCCLLEFGRLPADAPEIEEIKSAYKAKDYARVQALLDAYRQRTEIAYNLCIQGETSAEEMKKGFAGLDEAAFLSKEAEFLKRNKCLVILEHL
ncbi:MAG: hypothetical protein Q8O22_02385, partial [Candidatus Omnitrophota bacterium]|nr:hypothetical protein [Candidatus Omnitrophota bacterium]